MDLDLISGGFKANMASKQPRRSNLKSDLKSMAQTAYVTMFILAVLTSFWNLTEERKKKERKKEERKKTTRLY